MPPRRRSVAPGFMLREWVGAEPSIGADVAHLLLHPLGWGQEPRMRAAADLLGLAPADRPPAPDVPPDITLAVIGHELLTIHYAADEAASHTVELDWARVALVHHVVVLYAGLDPLPYADPDHVGLYLSRRHRLRVGVIRAVDGR